MHLLLWGSVGDPSPSAYWSQNSGAPWSVSSSGKALRFEVRSGDHWPEDPVGKERSEIAARSTFAFGRTYRIRYRFQVEPGPANTADWLVLGQIHQTDGPDAPNFSPPFEIDLNGERMAVVVRWAAGPSAAGIPPAAHTVWSDASPVRRGHWYEMVIDARFDPGGAGLLSVRRDGVRVARYRGALGFDNDIGPYWKEGVYRAAAPETIAVVFRDLSIVETRAFPSSLWNWERPAR